MFKGPVKLAWKSDAKNREKIPELQDFSPSSIQKAVLEETIQHPLTVFPTVGSLASLLYIALIGLTPAAFGIAVGGIAVGAGSWIVNYFFRGHTFERNKVQQLHEALAAQAATALENLKEDLVEADCPDGADQVDLLREKFESFRDLLSEKLNVEELTYGRYLAMGQQVYLSAINNLRQVVDSLKSIQTIDPTHIKQQLRVLKQRTSSSEVDREVAALNERSELRIRQLKKVEKLLADNQEAMLQLDRTTVAISDLVTTKGDADVDMETAMSELKEIAERTHEYSIRTPTT